MMCDVWRAQDYVPPELAPPAELELEAPELDAEMDVGAPELTFDVDTEDPTFVLPPAPDVHPTAVHAEELTSGSLQDDATATAEEPGGPPDPSDPGWYQRALGVVAHTARVVLPAVPVYAMHLGFIAAGFKNGLFAGFLPPP